MIGFATSWPTASTGDVIEPNGALLALTAADTTPCLLVRGRESAADQASFRRMDKRTGQIEHLKYNPPPPDAELDHRAESLGEMVMRPLTELDATTATLPRSYEHSGLVRQVGEAASRKDVTGWLLAALG